VVITAGDCGHAALRCRGHIHRRPLVLGRVGWDISHPGDDGDCALLQMPVDRMLLGLLIETSGTASGNLEEAV
jgi:hypothetical protein